MTGPSVMNATIRITAWQRGQTNGYEHRDRFQAFRRVGPGRTWGDGRPSTSEGPLRLLRYSLGLDGLPAAR